MSVIKSSSPDDKITHKGLRMDMKEKIKTIPTSKITKRYFNINPCLEDNIIVKCKKKKKYKIVG